MVTISINETPYVVLSGKNGMHSTANYCKQGCRLDLRIYSIRYNIYQ
jgi:hypothetical protein